MPIQLLAGMTADDLSFVVQQNVICYIDGSDSTKIEMYRGDSKNMLCALWDKQDNPLSIAGATIWFTIKDKTKLFEDDDTSSVLQLISTDSDEILLYDTLNGIFKIFIKPEHTHLLPYGNYEYDIQINLNDEVTTIKRGLFKIMSEVTRDYEV